jgi:hypothetical protein
VAPLRSKKVFCLLDRSGLEFSSNEEAADERRRLAIGRQFVQLRAARVAALSQPLSLMRAPPASLWSGRSAAVFLLLSTALVLAAPPARLLADKPECFKDNNGTV